MASDIHVVVLAAGQGTRMKSKLPKVLHPLSGRPLIEHVLRTADAISPATVTVIVGHGGDAVRERVGNRPIVDFAVQEPQLGTAHALQQAESRLAGKQGMVILLSGDVPLLTADTLRGLVETHQRAKAAATVVTAEVERPYGYGRIVRTRGRIAKIVEERDASPEVRQIREINSGIYAFDLPPLFDALRGIASQNAQGEFYLTDLVGIYRRRKLPVETFLVDVPEEIRGINSRTELAEVGTLVRQKKNEELMAAGVTLVDPATTFIDPRAEIGGDTVIHPGVVIEGPTRIGRACEIQAHVRIADAEIGDHVNINSFCVIVESSIASGASVGAGSKVNHLSYLGDATIGDHVNVGAGTITCNYDGEKKHQTVIEDGAFIGSDSQLVAPVKVGKGAYVAAGSSITQDVPDGALGIARARQNNIEGWVERKKAVPQKG